MYPLERRPRRLKKMIIFQSLFLMWLVSLTAGSTVTSGQDHTLPHLTIETSNWQLTEHEASTFKATSDVSDIWKPSVAAVKDEPASESATPTQQRPQFAASTMSTNVTASQNNSALMLRNESTESTTAATEPQFEDTAPPMNLVTNQTSDPSSAVTWMPTSPYQNQRTEQNAESTDDNQASTSPSQSTEFLSTPPTPTKPDKDESTRTNPSITPTDDLHSTLPFATKKMPVRTTQAKKGKDPPVGNSKKLDSHATIVASIIGGALIMMIIGFIAIFVQKRKYKLQQVLTKDWAGPSPFLENNTENGHGNLTSSNRISVSSFLPQRLSRKLSLLPEEDQELDDIMPGTTFGGKREASFLDSEQAENSLEESNGTAAAAPEVKSQGNGAGFSSHAYEAPYTDENSESDRPK